jgi:DNA-binding NarL/FixJ family response regulator
MPQPIFLIVEDHFNLQKGTQSTLREYFPGCECLLASSPKEAISILSIKQCKLALINLEYKNNEDGLDISIKAILISF